MGYSVIQVPQGQIVKIWQEGTFAFYGIIDGNVRLSVSSKFGPVIRGGDTQSTAGKIGDVLVSKAHGGQNTSGFSTVFPQAAARVWESTDPLGISLDFTYIQGLWGMTGPQIVAGVKQIMALSLPSLGGTAGSLIPPGPTVATIYADPSDDKEKAVTDTSPANLDRLSAEQQRQKQVADLAKFGNTIPGSESDIANGIRGFRYNRGRAINIKIGNYLEVKNVIVEASNPEFSDICDASGFPVWAKISVEVSSIISATTQLLGIDLKETIQEAANQISTSFLTGATSQ